MCVIKRPSVQTVLSIRHNFVYVLFIFLMLWYHGICCGPMSVHMFVTRQYYVYG